MAKKEDDAPLIASDRAKWDPEYQRQVGLKTGPARLSKKMQTKLADLSKEIYRLHRMSGYGSARLPRNGKRRCLLARSQSQSCQG
jgi:hypothetical protein